MSITTANTFQQALVSASRNNCLIQYNGSSTGYVFFGTTAAATTPASFQLSSKQAISCSAMSGVVATDAIQISATNTSDQFTISSE